MDARGTPSETGSERTSEGGAIILFCAADLLWATRIKETAVAMGFRPDCVRPVRNPDMLAARLAEYGTGTGRSGLGIAGLIVDLENPESVGLIRQLRASACIGAGEIPIIAFGPHVATDRLQAAREAGGPATSVMARGAFAAQLTGILSTLGRAAS